MSRTEIRIILRLPADSGQHIWVRATRVAWKFVKEFPDRKRGIRHGVVYTSRTDDDQQDGPALIAYRVKSGVVVYVEEPKTCGTCSGRGHIAATGPDGKPAGEDCPDCTSGPGEPS